MYNKAILIGRLTADPELKCTPSGVAVASFSLAVDRTYSKGGERQTDFINCVAWRRTAEFIGKYFSKGRLLGIEGVIQTRSYQDKQGGKRVAVEVVADKAFFTESKKAAGIDIQADDKWSPPGGGSDSFEEIVVEDDLPF